MTYLIINGLKEIKQMQNNIKLDAQNTQQREEKDMVSVKTLLYFKR